MKLGFIGMGNMAGAILLGGLSKGYFNDKPLGIRNGKDV